MALFKRFSSSPFAFLFLSLAGGLLMSMSNTGCSSSKACFYWTQAEGACPAQKDALPFFTDPFCTSTITSVDSEGTFEEDVCCYEVTEDSSSFNSFCNGGVPQPGSSSAIAVGVGGAGAAGGFGGAGGMGAGGTGGSETCAGCAQFLTDTMPPPLCDESVVLYESLTDCRCFGPCSSVCASNVCMGVPQTPECENCMLDTSMGCGTAFLQCVNDI